jgi:hypothetical protein
MGFREREQLVPEYVKERVKTHNRGRYEGIAGVPTLVIDGVVEGLWRRAKGAKAVKLEVEPARRLTAGERRGIEAESERIGKFLGLEPTLRVGRLKS